jgi:hypothetical protein
MVLQDISELHTIEIHWDGPISVEDVLKKANRGEDYGLYQLYGTHNVLGPDTLLYIGKAEANTFAERIASHVTEWIDWEASPIRVYLGRLGGVVPARKMGDEWKDWEDGISRAERLLIYFCAPPYNSQGLKNHGVMNPTIVLNYHRRHRLPVEVSTLYDASSYVTQRQQWKAFTID